MRTRCRGISCGPRLRRGSGIRRGATGHYDPPKAPFRCIALQTARVICSKSDSVWTYVSAKNCLDWAVQTGTIACCDGSSSITVRENVMVSTKKFLSALTADGRARRHGPFAMPAPDGSTQFVELESGKPHSTAYVVYTGVDLTASDVVSKASTIFLDHNDALCLAESLLVALQQFKVGNVVAVAANDRKTVQLRLVSTCPKSRPGPKLPG